MTKVQEFCNQKYQNNKTCLFFCMTVTFVIGMIAHSYMYFQDSFSHDSLREFNAGEFGNIWKIQLGRFIVPVYRILTRGNLTQPLIIGILSLLFLSFAIFFTVKSFRVTSKLSIVLIAGLFVTNISVISNTAAYIEDLDCNMLSLMFACIAVFAWQRFKHGFIFAVPFIFISMGLYQSFISVTLILMIIYLIVEILNGKKIITIFINGTKGILSVAAGALFYFIAYKAIIKFTAVGEADTYNSMSQLTTGKSALEIIKLIILTFKTSVYNILFLPTSFSQWIVAILIVLSFVSMLVIVLKKVLFKEIGIAELILMVLLATVMPIAADITMVLSGGTFHELTYYAIWLMYLLPLLSATGMKENNSERAMNIRPITKIITTSAKAVCCITLSVIIISNIFVSNEVYLKKDLDQDANLVFFSRVMDRMESFEDYDHKTMPVVFIGSPDYFKYNKPGFTDSYSIMGARGNFVPGAARPNFYRSYFEYKLNYSIVITDDEKYEELCKSSFVKNMPVFPDEGCIQINDGILIVKIG